MKINMFIFLSLIFSLSAYANLEIKNVNFKTLEKEGVVTILFSGKMMGFPEMVISNNEIKVDIKNASLDKPITKNISFATPSNDTKINASSFRKDVSIKTQVPFNLNGVRERVSMNVLDNKIEVIIPKLKAASTTVKTAQAPKAAPAPKKVVALKKVDPKAQELDKSYLDSLLALESSKENAAIDTNIQDGAILAESGADEVRLQDSSVESLETRSDKPSFSLITYTGKFVAFLGVILLFFYGLVTLMKKGVIKKGKIGFLHNADNVMVLSNTYVGPKKSLMLVKAHKQVFLVSNTEAGMQLISEVQDPAGLFKETEKSVAGTNFDVNLKASDDDEELDSKIKIKEDIHQSKGNSNLMSYVKNSKDQVKFSDQIKSKVKNLKPLQ